MSYSYCCLYFRILDIVLSPDKKPGIRRHPDQGEKDSECESSTEAGTGGGRGEWAWQRQWPGGPGDHHHLDQQEHAGPGQGAVQPARVEAVQMRHWDDEGRHAEEGEDQQLPHPEPIVYGSPDSTTAPNTWPDNYH